MTSAAAVLALCRFGQDTAAMLLWGASAYVAWLVPGDLASAVSARLGRWCWGAVVVTAAATVGKLPADVASIGDGWRDAVAPGMVSSVVVDTTGGHAWAGQALAALLVVAAQAAPARFRLPATATAAALLLAALSLTGHARLQEGGLDLLHRVVDIVHVLSAGLWLGALAPVLSILTMLDRPDWRPAAAVALRRFSQVGHGIVALVLISGASNAALVLGRWPIAFRSPYEGLLDAKILVVAVMVGLALVNRYVLVPRLARESRVALAMLRRATLAEIALGTCAIALVAIFGLLDPG